MMAANGAAHRNQCPQETVIPSWDLIKFTAMRFWAAAVFMPTFHMLSAWAVAIIMTAAKRLFRSTPRAMMMPMTIGTRHDTRAVVLGTKKLKTKPTIITPAIMRLAVVPTFERTKRAIRLSSPVFIIAAAMNTAPATRAKAVLLKPPRAIVNPLVVPHRALGFAGSGDRPRIKAIAATIMAALTG